MTWWTALCALAFVNLVAWGVSAWQLQRRADALSPDVYATRRLILWLAAGYVLGCAFRSVLPMVDVPRICLHETPLSRIAVGRTVATFAELCIAAQFSLLLLEAGRGHRRRALIPLSAVLFGLIVVAEGFSWAAVLQANFFLHAIENSLWTVAAVLGVGGFVALWPRLDAGGRRFVLVVLLNGALYVGFMTTVDVPMYVSRALAATAGGHTPLAIAAGLDQILNHCKVVRDWAAWRDDVAWLTLYFSTAVWMSIALAHAPPLVPVRGAPGRD